MKAHYQNVLLGSAIALSLVFGFASCTSDDDDDDDENAITKVNNNNFTIAYTNNGTGSYRGYKTSDQNHLGGIMQITFNKDSLDDVAAMAYIWDLEGTTKTSDRSAKNPRRFCIAGVRTDGKKAYPYVSVYTNVVDIEEVNFGVNTKITATENNKGEENKGKEYTATEEDKYLELNYSKNSFSVTPDDNGNVVVTIAATPKNDSDTITTSGATKYVVTFYNGAHTKEEIEASGDNALSANVTAQEISFSDLGYASVLKQQTVGVYTNVKEGKTLNGSWKYVTDYADADVVEE